jgi:hypothetical protein
MAIVTALTAATKRWTVRRTAWRDESGAIAIVVALLSTVMFSCAALSVDLGNAWARGRTVQKQVDIGALSVGWMLPMTPANQGAIAQEVADYFNSAYNEVPGQAVVSAAQLLNGAAGDGEITFQHSDGTPCTDKCPQMRVLAPGARVDFGLAAIMGVDHTMVQKAATVRIGSEVPDKPLPFWLPTGCGDGPDEADTKLAGAGGPTPTSSPTPTADAPYVPSPIGTHILQGAAVTEVGYGGSTVGSGFFVTAVGNQFKKVTLRAFPPTGTSYVDYAAETSTQGAVPNFNISTELSMTPGDWRVYAVIEKQNGGGDEYSTNYLVIRVTNAPATPTPTTDPDGEGDPTVGCLGQDRGNFGQLDSPRKEGGTKQERLARNIAMGIDHSLVPYHFPDGVTERKDCDSGTPLPGAQLDDVSRNNNNCITGDTGNDGPKMYDGLVAGVAGFAPGRLDVANGHTTCPGRSDISVDGKLLNNDVLSCFLRNGATLADIASPTGVTTAMLDKAVMKSPRFVWLPVVYASDRAQKGYQPIRYFVPGFITDETQTSAATSANGLDINGNSVSVLHVFIFNRKALPTKEESKTTEYDPDLGAGIVRLVG